MRGDFVEVNRIVAGRHSLAVVGRVLNYLLEKISFCRIIMVEGVDTNEKESKNFCLFAIYIIRSMFRSKRMIALKALPNKYLNEQIN